MPSRTLIELALDLLAFAPTKWRDFILGTARTPVWSKAPAPTRPPASLGRACVRDPPAQDMAGNHENLLPAPPAPVWHLFIVDAFAADSLQRFCRRPASNAPGAWRIQRIGRGWLRSSRTGVSRSSNLSSLPSRIGRNLRNSSQQTAQWIVHSLQHRCRPLVLRTKRF